jgi:hypothetical protein
MPRAYPKGELLRGAPVILTNFLQDWKSLPGAHTLAYYESLSMMDAKSFISLKHRHKEQFNNIVSSILSKKEKARVH